MIPYARQWIDDEDVEALVRTLRSDFLTTGPKVAEFERAVADYVGAGHGVAFSSGTAALHAAMHVLGIGPGDEVIVPAMTFAATANCVLYTGARPVLADVEPETLLLDPLQVRNRITPRTRAVISVDYSGHPSDFDALQAEISGRDIFLTDDACHALSAEYKGKKVGTLADLTVFSFHPVKPITTGEGGMVMTDDPDRAEALRRFRHHGVELDPNIRQARNDWAYDIVELGYNYRLTDLQCALGLSQLKRLPEFLRLRRQIADRYDQAFAEIPGLEPLTVRSWAGHARHLYVVRIKAEQTGKTRREVFSYLRANGVGVNVHYIPLHYFSYYKENLGVCQGMFPVAEKAYDEIISLPMFPGLPPEDVDRIVEAVKKAVS